MKKSGILFLILFSTNALFSMSFLERQYNNVTKDLTLIKNCYLKKSCTLVERDQAPHALMRVTAEGIVLAGMLMAGVYAFLRSPGTVKKTASSTAQSQPVVPSQREIIAIFNSAIKQAVYDLLPSEQYTVELRENKKNNTYGIYIGVPQFSQVITDKKGNEIIETLSKTYQYIAYVQVKHYGVGKPKNYFPESTWLKLKLKASSRRAYDQDRN